MAKHCQTRLSNNHWRWCVGAIAVFLFSGCTASTAPEEAPKKAPDAPPKRHTPFERETVSVRKAQYTPDGKWIVTLDTMGRINVWDATKDRSQEEIKKPAYTLTTKDEARPDGPLLVMNTRVVYCSDKVCCRDFNTGKLIWEVSVTGLGTNTRLFAAKLDQLIVALPRHVLFIDCRTGQLLRRIELPFETEEPQISSNGATLIAINWRLPRQRLDLKKIDLVSGKLLFTYPHNKQIVTTLISSDGKLGISVGQGICHQWNLETDKLIASTPLPGGSMMVANVELTRFAFIDNAKNKIWIWDSKQKKVIHEFFQDQVGVTSAAFSPDGEELMLAGVGFNKFGAQSERKDGVLHTLNHAIILFDWRKGTMLRTIAFPWPKPF